MRCACRPYFLSLNRYERKKEVELAVRALSIVRGRRKASGSGTDVRLVVAGALGAGWTFAPMEGIHGMQGLLVFVVRVCQGPFITSLYWILSLFFSGLSGGYDVRLPENVEYLEELRRVALSEGISECVQFLTSISDAQKTSLLRGALAVLYTPQVSKQCSTPCTAGDPM